MEKKIVLCRWSDIESNSNSWQTIDEAIEFHEEPTIIEQVGFIIYEDEKSIILTDSVCDKLELIGNSTRILNCNILDIKEL
jgi:hypothetical protein